MLLPGPFHCVLRSLEFKDVKAGHEGLTRFWPETTEEVKRLDQCKNGDSRNKYQDKCFRWKKTIKLQETQGSDGL